MIDGADHWNRKILSLGPSAFRELSDQVREASIRYGLWGEIDRGVRTPFPLMCRPRLMALSCREYVHRAAWLIRMGLSRMARLAADNPQAASLMLMAPHGAEWIRGVLGTGAQGMGTGAQGMGTGARSENGPEASRLFCRLDAFVSFKGPGWRSTMKFMEPNGIGTGGITYAPAAEALFLDIVAPAVAGSEGAHAVEKNADPRWLLYGELLRHARSVGIRTLPVVAFVDDKSLYDFGGEFGRLTSFYEGMGLPVVFADPEELRSDRRGRLYVRGHSVDMCFRFLELADFAEMESAGKDLEGVRTAFSRGLMFPSPAGDIEDKSAFELLTHPDFASAFSRQELRVFRDHVLWTRLLFDRKTPLPDGRVVDLAEYARTRRHMFVLKPNRGCGGQGVVIGDCVDQAEWDQALEQALRKPRTFVLQWVCPTDTEDFPEAGPHGLTLAPHYSTAGFFPCRSGLGVFGRHSKDRIVNLQQGGGVVPFLVNAR